MKKIVLAAVVAGLCSLNLAGADEDIAKFEAGCNAGIAQDCTRAGAQASKRNIGKILREGLRIKRW